MKIILLFLILVNSGLFAQEKSIESNKELYSYYEYLKNTKLERKLISDSLEYEVRFWYTDRELPIIFIQIRKDFSGNWDYSIGFLNLSSDSRVSFQDSIKREVDWDIFEKKWSLFVNLPDEKDIELSHFVNGSKFILKDLDFSMYSYREISPLFEIFNNKSVKQISYSAPAYIMKEFNKIGVSTPEHMLYIDFIDYLFKEFNILKLYKIKFKELFDA